jgi:hypothetical protein
MRKISDIGFLTRQTSHYIGLSRGRAGADIEKGCFVPSFVSSAVFLSVEMTICSAVECFPAAQRNISFGGQV